MHLEVFGFEESISGTRFATNSSGKFSPIILKRQTSWRIMGQSMNDSKTIGTNNSSNSSITEMPNCSETLDRIFWVINGVLAVVIFAGNSVTCAIFLSSKQLRQQHMNKFLVSLAVSDILMAVMVIPGYAAFCGGCQYLSGDACWILAQTKDLVLSSSFFSLLAITYDRYLAVLRPLQYSSTMSRRKVTCILTAIWVVPAVVATMRNIWWQTQREDKATSIDRMYNVILVFLLVVVPALIMTVVNALIVRAIQQQKRRTIPLREQRSTNQRVCNDSVSIGATRSDTTRGNRRGTIACAAVVLVFVLSWVPRSVYNFSFVFGRSDLVTPLLVKVSMFFLFLQSCVNPFIYSFYRADFRQAAKRIIKFRP